NEKQDRERTSETRCRPPADREQRDAVVGGHQAGQDDGDRNRRRRQPEEQAEWNRERGETESDELAIEGSHAGPPDLGGLADMEVVDPLEEAVFAKIPFLDDRMEVPLEALALLARAVVRRLDKHGY